MYDVLTYLWRENTAAWANELDATCAKLGISYVDRIIVSILAKHKHLTKKDLAQKLNTIHQNLTRSIKRLDSEGIIIITKNKYDKRILYIALTAKGKSIENKLRKTIDSTWQKALKNISAKDIAKLGDLLQIMRDNLMHS